MTSGKSQSNEFLPLSNMSFHILLALGDGPAHGYAIGKEIQESSEGKLNPTTGGLYQALKRLTDDGMLRPATGATSKSSDSRRQYFQLTKLGRSVVALEAQRMNQLVSATRRKRLFTQSA